MKERKESGYELREAKKKEEIRRERKQLTRKERREAKKKDKRRAKQKKEVNKEFARVTYIFVALFLVLMGYIIYFNLEKSQDIINSSYNPRLDSMADRVVRGKILDKDGNVLAETTTAEDGSEYRYYPYGNLYAHVVGSSSQGKSGLESAENFELLTSHAFFLEKLKNEFQDEKNIGDNVITTLNTQLQEAAYNALGSYKGAVVVLEPSSGKILAMVSKPDFDPNTVAENWEFLSTDENSYLLNLSLIHI